MENNVKKDAEVLAEVYRNARLALASIEDILPETEEGPLKEEIKREYGEYEGICGKAALIAKKYGVELKEPNPIKKAMMWTGVKMKTANDNSRNHVAEMMIKGTVTGITCLKTTLTQSERAMGPDVKELLCELIALEESFETKLKAYL